MEEVESNKGKLNMMSGGWANLAAKSGGNIVVSFLDLSYESWVLD